MPRGSVSCCVYAGNVGQVSQLLFVLVCVCGFFFFSLISSHVLSTRRCHALRPVAMATAPPPPPPPELTYISVLCHDGVTAGKRLTRYKANT